MLFDIDEVQTTLVRIELQVDGNVEFVKNVAKGEINDVLVLGDEFEAMKGEAQVIVKVKNTDLIAGEFTIQIKSQSDDLIVLPSYQKSSIDAKRSQSFSFNL